MPFVSSPSVSLHKPSAHLPADEVVDGDHDADRRYHILDAGEEFRDASAEGIAIEVADRQERPNTARQRRWRPYLKNVEKRNLTMPATTTKVEPTP